MALLEIVQTPTFRRSIKKLYTNQKKELDKAIKTIAKDPSIGQVKKGDLAGVQVYKFKMVNQLILVAYRFDDEAHQLILLAFGTHENFYRDLKK